MHAASAFVEGPATKLEGVLDEESLRRGSWKPSGYCDQVSSREACGYCSLSACAFAAEASYVALPGAEGGVCPG